MSEKDDFITLLQSADLIMLHIGTRKIGLGPDLIHVLIEGAKLLPDVPPADKRSTLEVDKDGMVQWIPPT